MERFLEKTISLKQENNVIKERSSTFSMLMSGSLLPTDAIVASCQKPICGQEDLLIPSSHLISNTVRNELKVGS